jgi:hypothetical protein
VRPQALTVIPHGVPAFVPPSSQQLAAVRAELGAAGRTVLLTNGLINPGKGIDVVIEALPGIVAANASVLYVVAGQPHPT